MKGRCVLNLNKSELYSQVAKKTNVNKNIIDKVFKTTEHIVFDFLADVDENEIRKVFLMNGICAESKVLHRKERNIPKGNTYPEERIFVNAKISKRYKEKINQNR